MSESKVIAWLLAMLCAAGVAWAQATAPTQTETDEYTRYELLVPDSASFAIHYEVTATTAGARYFFNPIRKGSAASGESVLDVMTGQPIRFEVVSGEEAVKDPLMKGEDTAVDYIKVYLARPVPPANGQARLLILKTYKDAKTYYREGDTIVFNRSLSIPRNSVVLPVGYELAACNIPSQVLTQPDGRIVISFMNGGGVEAPLVVKAKLGAQIAAAAPRPPGSAKSWEAPFEGETEQERLSECAHQDREIVYFLQQPETHSFSLYHDYTESRAGADKYFNVVRSGSKVSDPAAYILDTGEKLTTKIMTGADLATAKLDAGEPVDPAA